MTISKGRIALLAGVGVVALGIFILIFFFQRQPAAPAQAPSGNELNAAGTQGMQFTFGGENPNAVTSGGQGSLFFQPSSQSAASGLSAGNAFLPAGNISLNGNTNIGVSGGLSGGTSFTSYVTPSLNNLINTTFPFGLNSTSVFDVLGNISSYLGPQDAYTQSLIDQYQSILAKQQKLYEMAQNAQQSVPTIPSDLFQQASNGQVTLSLSAIQQLLNSQARATAAFSGEINSANNQLINLLNSQISEAKDAGVVFPELQSAIDQLNQFNSSVSSVDQQVFNFNTQTTDLLNQFLASSSGTISADDAQNLLNQINASTTALQSQMQALQSQAQNLYNSIGSQY